MKQAHTLREYQYYDKDTLAVSLTQIHHKAVPLSAERACADRAAGTEEKVVLIEP